MIKNKIKDCEVEKMIEMETINTEDKMEEFKEK